ncbi:hypothetical protein QBC36DRAFT_34974 [Triangularia setosa]|uniref:Secreted protein n=1 Tax=Triangularia setosa TaxID=2587417 RepID=A0AAN7A461_9PEZI|nr:hypothetical protein QBC36DRAFT_34974 [Podospora setosa]
MGLIVWLLFLIHRYITNNPSCPSPDGLVRLPLSLRLLVNVHQPLLPWPSNDRQKSCSCIVAQSMCSSSPYSRAYQCSQVLSQMWRFKIESRPSTRGYVSRDMIARSHHISE